MRRQRGLPHEIGPEGARQRCLLRGMDEDRVRAREEAAHEGFIARLGLVGQDIVGEHDYPRAPLIARERGDHRQVGGDDLRHDVHQND